MKRTIILCLVALATAGCQCRNQAGSTPEMASEQGLVSGELEARYVIIVNAYRQREYAEKKVKDLEQKGYPASIVSFRNGLLAVAVCPSDDLDLTRARLEKLRSSGDIPKESWILTLR